MGNIRNVKKKNNKLADKLKGKYENVISNVFCYVRAELNSIDAERALNDILMLLDDEYEKGTNLDEYILDVRSFVNPFLKKYKKSKSYKFSSLIYDYLPVGVYGISFFVIIDMIFKILKSNERVFENMIKVNYILRPSIYIAALLIFLFVMMTVKNITKILLSNGKGSAIIANIVSCLVLSVAVAIGAFFLNKNGIFNIVTFTVSKCFISVLSVLVVVFILNMIFGFKLRKK